MNYSDAERIATILEKYKMKPAASIDEADLVVFVTCGVRQSAEDRAYGQINNIKKKYPGKHIILTGCLAYRKDVQEKLRGKVDLFTTIKNFPKETKSLTLRNGESLAPARKKPNFEKKDYLKINPKYTNPYIAYVPIMTGCNNFCSYCVVPYARSREYSRPAKDILKEVKDLVKKGYKEIVLLGQNVNSYKNLPCQGEMPEGQRGLKNSPIKLPSLSSPLQEGRIPEINFPKLLKLIEKIPGNFWLTFLTSHPKDMSDELIETIAKSKKICEYISLPAQSGDNEILRRMNRKYTVSHYKNLIKKIRAAFGGIRSLQSSSDRIPLIPAISTDIIVGFPGETKKQFENTARLMREMKFDMAYIAQYSPRPETAAWKMKDNVSKKEKERREKVLTEILKKTALENNKKYVGKMIEVLVDKVGLPTEALVKVGHTRTQKKVVFYSTKKIPVGSFAKVKILKAKKFGLEGETI